MSDERQAESSTRDLIDGAVRRTVTGLVIASGIIGLAIYSRPGPARYQAFAAEGRIVRVDTRSGTVIACEENRCMTIVRKGQRLRRTLPGSPKQGTQPPRPLPAPTQPSQSLSFPEQKAEPAEQ